MKRFVLIVILFLLPIVLFYSIIELGIRHIPNDYSCKNAWLEKNISTLEVLIVGSSHSYYGLDPKCFDAKVFNAAHVSQSLKYDEFIVEKFIPRADSLKYVILPISYFSLFSELEDGDEWWRAKKYCIYYGCPYHRLDTKYCMEITGVDTYRQLQLLKKYWVSGIDNTNIDSLGFGQDHMKTQRAYADWYMDGLDRAKLHTMKMDDKRLCAIRDNKARVERIVQLCNDHNINVLLLTIPTCKSYYDNLDAEQYQITVNFCDSLAQACNNVRYINWMTDNRFTEDDFFDSDHLCDTGAEKLSKLISLELR